MANQRLELTWIGKDEEPAVEPRILLHDPSKDYGDPNAENMLIHGDNLLALKALEQEYAGQVKCIYIDPPYNTGEAVQAQISHVAGGGFHLPPPQAAVQVGEPRQVPPGGVLAHQGEQNGVGRELSGHPVHHGLGLVHLPGEDQVADHRPPAQQPLFVQLIGAGLADHLPDGGLGGLRVVGGVGAPRRRPAVQVFQVGQVDGDPPLQGPQGLHPVIPPGVPHHRHGQGLLQRLAHRVGVVGGADEVDVVGPLSDEFTADLPQALHRDGLAEVLLTDGRVLAEHTVQGAAGEKDGPRSPDPGDRGLLPHVEGRTGDHRRLRHPAPALARGFGPQRPAPAGTEIADHGTSS